MPTSNPTATLAPVFKALGDPTRLAIFELIRADLDPSDAHSTGDIARSVSQIAARFEVSLSTVSHHLKELRTAGLIRCERRGQSIYCSIAPDLVEEIEHFFQRP
ncbi:MAG TPA: metalloregulator ArsR/SmtB family transcription factor [Candidatus Limnocylindrales bacterium]